MTDIAQRLRLVDPNQVLLAPPPHDMSYLQVGLICHEAAAEIERLRVENEALRKAYWKMRNSAAGYSNYCDDNASTRRCERDYTEGEALYRAAIDAATAEERKP